MIRYTVRYFDGRRDPETGGEEWFPVRLPSGHEIQYTDRLMAEAVAEALVFTGHCLKTRIMRLGLSPDESVKMLEISAQPHR